MKGNMENTKTQINKQKKQKTLITFFSLPYLLVDCIKYIEG